MMDDAMTEEAGEAASEDQIRRLVPKKETIIWLVPSTEQMSIYQKVLEKSDVIREACAKTKLGVEVFRAIGLLKRLCNHPLLLLPTPKPSAWADILSEVSAAKPLDAAVAAAPALPAPTA